MVLEHCSNCDGRHPAPLDEDCPFPTCEQPAPKRTTSRTRGSPSLSPPPPPKRGRGRPRGSMSPSLSPPPPPPPKRGRGRPLGSKGKGRKAPPQRHQSPEASFDAQDQPDSPHSSTCPTPRDSGMQPPCAPQLVDPQVAAIQAIADQLARMQQEAKAYQAAAARDREADRQEMLRRTAAAQPAPGPSHPDVALTRPSFQVGGCFHQRRHQRRPAASGQRRGHPGSSTSRPSLHRNQGTSHSPRKSLSSPATALTLAPAPIPRTILSMGPGCCTCVRIASDTATTVIDTRSQPSQPQGPVTQMSP